tara:strand:+ start:1280 stop:1954 length:675 start_codon:yes stop_codon:yes gene_type:complete
MKEFEILDFLSKIRSDKENAPEITIFNRYNEHRIPEKSGIYGWFLPLKLNSNDRLDNQLIDIDTIFSYDSISKNTAERSAEINYNWESQKITLTKNPKKITFNNESIKRYNKAFRGLVKNHDENTNFMKMLALATIFTKPLYIGLTDNLNGRYYEHKTANERNNFHNRFTNFVKDYNEINEKKLRFNVDELVYITVHHKSLSKDNLELLEYILKIICKPAFGER